MVVIYLERQTPRMGAAFASFDVCFFVSIPGGEEVHFVAIRINGAPALLIILAPALQEILEIYLHSDEQDRLPEFVAGQEAGDVGAHLGEDIADGGASVNGHVEADSFGIGDFH
jgi:hypothetical protein